MALKSFFFAVINFLWIYSCFSKPFFNSGVSFDKFVLDGKKDCDLANNNPNVNKLFKIISCPTLAEKFSSNYFHQRDVLPCFGAYDALFNLCEFPPAAINFTTPEIFKDSEKFCIEAKAVYEHHPFKYTNSEVKQWGDTLLSTMINETLCDNLCVMGNLINDECIAMLTFANEYIHLKGASQSDVILSKSEKIDTQLNDQTTISKSTSEVKTASSTPPKNNTGSTIVTKPSEDSIDQKTGVIITPSNNTVDNVKRTETVIQNSEKSKFGSKPSLQLESNPANIDPGIVTQKEEENVLETEKPKKDMKPLKNDKNMNTSPITGISSTPKGSPNVNEESINDGNKEIITDGDMHGETDDAFIDAKGNEGPDEENEKPEEEKNTVPEAEQHVAMMSPSFNAMADNFSESEDSYSFTYIVTTMAALCCVYLLFHYRNKLLALALEGRKGRSSRGRGRPSSANYSKLHSNLEEAIASNVTTPSATHVLY